MFSELKHRAGAASLAALEMLPGAVFDDKIEFLANVLGIAGFALSLALLLFGPLYRHGRRRLATQGDLARLGGAVVEKIGDRIAEQLAAAAVKAGGSARRPAPEDDDDRLLADLGAAVAAIVEDPSDEGRAAAAALLEGDTRPAERVLAQRAAECAAEDPHRAAEALHLKAALQSTHDLRGAARQCGEAVRAEPESALGWSRLGQIYLRLGQAAKAREAFERAIALEQAERAGGQSAMRFGGGRLSA